MTKGRQFIRSLLLLRTIGLKKTKIFTTIYNERKRDSPSHRLHCNHDSFSMGWRATLNFNGWQPTTTPWNEFKQILTARKDGQPTKKRYEKTIRKRNPARNHPRHH